MSTPDAVRMHDVEVRVAPGDRLLGPVSVRIRQGERWVLLGPNGGGKTTLLSVAGAWRMPSSGRAWVLGARLGGADLRSVRSRIGHVGHTVSSRLRGSMRVRDVVLSGRTGVLETWLQGDGALEAAVAEERLAEVGCAGLADRALDSCSQGERARVLLARALYGRRELLILDEPAAGLDLPGREALLRAVDGVDEGVTVMLATHHLEEVPGSVTHAALVRGGALLEAGPAAATLTDGALSELFGMPIAVQRRGRRWSATARW
jgi:iron complex transport system ATP-binding protein